MTTTCPNGHESTWPDWCSTCGERLGPVVEADPGAPSAAAPPAAPSPAAPVAVPTGPTCQNCGVSRHEHDVFCESCGYDFASGSLPEASAPESAASAAVAASPMHAKISIDADFFAVSVGDAELSMPDPLPAQQIVPLPGIRVLIGRQSTSRGIFPEIDVLALTNDPAVSSRHAMFERDPDGNWTLTDLGSTNGTFLTPSTDDPIDPGVALPLAPGTAIYIGAWTRIELAETPS